MEGPTPKGHSDGVWRKGRRGSNNFQAQGGTGAVSCG